MRDERGARVAFCLLWGVLCGVKGVLAVFLPVFVDEAFYWQESRHLAWAYSDLPGLTAWLIAMGQAWGGDGAGAMRWPFLLLGAAVPWGVVVMAREARLGQGWHAGLLALGVPLVGTMGILALPDVPLTAATVLCLWAGVRLVRGDDSPATSVLLAAGLAMGALSHYRFLAVIGVGCVVLLVMPEGRRALRSQRVWGAIAVGALAWVPLLGWNLAHGEAGWRFQLVDRHPWALHADGWRFLPIQIALVTPPLFVAMLVAASRVGRYGMAPVRYLALCGTLTLAGFFGLGFVADAERVSFHWPLPAWLALLPLVPALLVRWPRAWRRVTGGILILALAGGLGGFALVAAPAGREWLARHQAYPENFGGWRVLGQAVQARLSAMPPDTKLLADNFKIGAELGFFLGRADISVLEHPLNARHGRAAQLAQWGLMNEGRESGHALLVVGVDDVKFSALLAHYQSLCRRIGALPPAHLVMADAGEKRFALFALPAVKSDGPCVTPAIAHVEMPAPDSQLFSRLHLRGWAVKDGVGLAGIRVRIGDQVLAYVQRDQPADDVIAFLHGVSTDPDRPRLRFEVDIDLRGVSRGRQRLWLDLVGRDGSVEIWPGPWLDLRPDPVAAMP